MQLSANGQFTILQSRPYPDDLYYIPCPEIWEAMGLAPEFITRAHVDDFLFSGDEKDQHW